LFYLNANVRLTQPIGREAPDRGSVHLLEEIGSPSDEVSIKRRPVGLVSEADVDRAVEPDAIPAQLAGREEEVLNAAAALWRRRHDRGFRHQSVEISCIRAGASKQQRRGTSREPNKPLHAPSLKQE